MLYVLYSPKQKITKIGISDSLENRVRGIRNGSTGGDSSVVVVGVFNIDNSFENLAHRLLIENGYRPIVHKYSDHAQSLSEYHEWFEIEPLKAISIIESNLNECDNSIKFEHLGLLPPLRKERVNDINYKDIIKNEKKKLRDSKKKLKENKKTKSKEIKTDHEKKIFINKFFKRKNVKLIMNTLNSLSDNSLITNDLYKKLKRIEDRIPFVWYRHYDNTDNSYLLEKAIQDYEHNLHYLFEDIWELAYDYTNESNNKYIKELIRSKKRVELKKVLMKRYDKITTDKVIMDNSDIIHLVNNHLDSVLNNDLLKYLDTGYMELIDAVLSQYHPDRNTRDKMIEKIHLAIEKELPLMSRIKDLFGMGGFKVIPVVFNYYATRFEDIPSVNYPIYEIINKYEKSKPRLADWLIYTAFHAYYGNDYLNHIDRLINWISDVKRDSLIYKTLDIKDITEHSHTKL